MIPLTPISRHQTLRVIIKLLIWPGRLGQGQARCCNRSILRYVPGFKALASSVSHIFQQAEVSMLELHVLVVALVQQYIVQCPQAINGH